MSAIDDLSKAREALYGGVWTWEEDRGRRWTLYVDRDEPITDELPRGHICNQGHGANILSGDFDANGEALRAFILAAANKVPALAAERDAERKAWARLVRAMDVPTEAAGHAEMDAACRALRDLGVDADALPEGA